MDIKRALRNSWLASLLASSAVCLCASASNPSTLGETDAALDLLLTRKAQEILDTHQLRESKPLGASVSASVDILQRKMVIRFGPGVLPLEDDHSLEEMEQYVRNTLEAYALQAGVGEVEIVMLYEGRLYWEHFPRSVLTPLQAVPGQAGGSVLVSASHGLLRTHPDLQWEFQRPERNGVLEDLITPGYADELARLLSCFATYGKSSVGELFRASLGLTLLNVQVPKRRK